MPSPSLTHLPPHILSLVDELLCTKSRYWFPTPGFLYSKEVQLVSDLWDITLTQWLIRWMEYKEMRGRENFREVREEKKVFRMERRGYGNTGGVNERWGVNPYVYSRVGGAGEGEMRVGGDHSGNGDSAPSHDFRVHNRMERESLEAAPFHDYHVSWNTTPSHDFHVARKTTPSHDFHVRGHNRVERESLVVPGELHPREASMTSRNSPPANENAPPSQDFHAFLMEVEGTPFLNSMEEAGRFARQRRR